ncbi:heparanase-like protein 1 isoform X7 [Triticum aestivum]|nr:heparanase-like protein 1 isoform X7 [Triticum aestivum]
MGATLLKGQGFIVCTHIKEKLGMFLCSDLVRKYYIMQFPISILYKKVGLKYLRHWPLQWRHPTSSTRRGGVSTGSPRNNKIHLNSLPMSYQFFERDYDPWWLLRRSLRCFPERGSYVLIPPSVLSALLWHRLMGNGVLSVDINAPRKLCAYAHFSKRHTGVMLLLFNLSDSTGYNVTL